MLEPGNQFYRTLSVGICRAFNTSASERVKGAATASIVQDSFVTGLPVLNYTTLITEYCFLFGGALLNSSGPPEMIHDPILTYYGASPTILFSARFLESPCGPFDWV
jgi:hypothetical protein